MSLLLVLSIALSIIAITFLIVNPHIGFILLILFKPIIDTSYSQPLLYDLTITKIVGAVVPLLIFSHIPFNNLSKEYYRMPMKGIWTLYATYVFIFSSIIAVSTNILDGAEVFLRHIHGFIGFFAIQAFFRDKRKLEKLLLAMIFAGVFPTCIGLYQASTGVVWQPRQAEGLVRYVGLYNDVLTLRLYELQTIIGLVLYGAIFTLKRGILFKVSAAIYGSLAVVVILKAWTKAGILILVWWMLVWMIYRQRLLLLALFLLIVITLLSQYWSVYFAPVEQLFRKEIGAIQGEVAVTRTFEGRWVDWIPMIDQWKNLGVIQQFFGSGIKATDAHNDYLQMLFHGGVIGLCIYVYMLICAGLVLMKNCVKTKDPLSVVAIMLFSMYLIDMIGLVPSSYPAYQWLTWGIIGLSMRHVREKSSPALQK